MTLLLKYILFYFSYVETSTRSLAPIAGFLALVEGEDIHLRL
jgi:hypothetical protein